MRLCGKCKIEKCETDFAWHRKALNQYQSYCRSCQKVYRKKNYEDNSKEYKALVTKRKAAIKEIIINIKHNTPCKDCGILYPSYAMDFDHLNDKEFNISQGISYGYSLDHLNSEIEKCEIVCSNCHRIRTHITRRV